MPLGLVTQPLPQQPLQYLIILSLKKLFPKIQCEPPLEQLEAISSCSIACSLKGGTSPHLATTSFQGVMESNKDPPEPPFVQVKQPQHLQLLLTKLVLQTLPQPLSHFWAQSRTSRPFLRGPKVSKDSRWQLHQCPVSVGVQSLP